MLRLSLLLGGQQCRSEQAGVVQRVTPEQADRVVDLQQQPFVLVLLEMADKFQQLFRPALAPFLENAVQRSLPQDCRVALVQHLKAGIHAGLNGVFPEESRAEAVDGGDVGPFQAPLLPLQARPFQPLGQAGLHLGSSVFRKGDGQRSGQIQPAVQHSAGDSFHQHARLA